MRSNRIENSIRFGAWLTETFGRFRLRPRFSIQFSISSPVSVRNRRIEPKFGLLNLSTESKSVCWETTKVSKVVFSSLFFFHRITVKPSPRQLDQGALLANFLHKRTLCSVCAIFFFFFYLPRRRFKPFFGSRGFFFCFRLFECCCVFFSFYFILFTYVS